MTAMVKEPSDTDFFSTTTQNKDDQHTLASDTDASADTIVTKQEEEPAQGVFGRLFGRPKKEEPSLQNGASDLLDEQRPEANLDEREVDEKEGEEGGGEEELGEEESEEEVSGDEEESNEGDENSNLQQDEAQNVSADNVSPKQDEEPAQGVFGRLFRRRKKEEPSLQNGAADLLDDQRPEGNHGESEVDEEEGEEEEEVSSNEEESEEGDENSNLQQDEAQNVSSDTVSPKKDEEPAQGVFGRLFRRRTKEEPSLQNGAADLLDDQMPETNHDEISEEDEEEEENESDDEDSEEEDENSILHQDEAQDGFDADFALAGTTATNKYNDESDEDEDEMMSLIGGPKNSNSSPVRQNLGASWTKFIPGFGAAKQEEGKGDKEKQSLLHDNYETDEDDDFHEEENTDQKQSLTRSSSGDYYHDSKNDESDEDENDCRSEPGEYRLESFYPSDSGYMDAPLQSHYQGFNGRIQGFGCQSALGYNHNAMDSSFTNAIGDPSMSSMDIESSNERGGILNGVGKAVSNITQFITARRQDVQDDVERKRMLQYISELEHKLVEKEKELQSWKERAEQLQSEVSWLKEEEGETDEEDDDEDEEEEDGENDENEVKETALILFEGDTAYADKIDSEDTVVQEGTLIDMSPAQPIFDPLEEKREEGKNMKVDDDILDLANFKQLAVTSEALRPSDDVLDGGAAEHIEKDGATTKPMPKEPILSGEGEDGGAVEHIEKEGETVKPKDAAIDAGATKLTKPGPEESSTYLESARGRLG